MNSLQREIVIKGFEKMKNSSLTICSIVRDCNNNLKQNIPVIEELRSSFDRSSVIIFENDSNDGTKQTLEKWSQDFKNVNIFSENYNQQTIKPETLKGANKFYSAYRISKMVEFRNKYLDAMKELKIVSDFILIIDLDITRIIMNGIAHSFGFADYWDVVCANGYSYSPTLSKRYHDTYALVELGKENEIQTEKSISENHAIWSFLKPGLPLIPVYSAFGGLAIYHFDVLKNKRYRVLKNNDDRVEVMCEHFSLCQDIWNSGFRRIYINPSMSVCNHKLTRKVILSFLERKFSRKAI